MTRKSDTAQSTWIDISEASQLTGISTSTIAKWCSSGAIPPECGRRFGYVWRFRRSVIENDGFSGVDREKIRTFRERYAPTTAACQG